MDLEKTIEFIVAHQARFAEQHVQMAQEVQAIARATNALIEIVQENHNDIHALRKDAEEDRAAMRELREDVQQVTENVSALVKVVWVAWSRRRPECRSMSLCVLASP